MLILLRGPAPQRDKLAERIHALNEALVLKVNTFGDVTEEEFVLTSYTSIREFAFAHAEACAKLALKGCVVLNGANTWFWESSIARALCIQLELPIVWVELDESNSCREPLQRCTVFDMKHWAYEYKATEAEILKFVEKPIYVSCQWEEGTYIWLDPAVTVNGSVVPFTKVITERQT